MLAFSQLRTVRRGFALKMNYVNWVLIMLINKTSLDGNKIKIRNVIRTMAACASIIAVTLTVAAASFAPTKVFADDQNAPQPLPSGYLSVKGNQFVGPNGKTVRIACVGGFGTVIVGGRLDYSGPYKGLDANIAAVKEKGFNCIRVDWINKNLDDPVTMGQFDDLVAACGKYGIKVIFDNHNNEATPASWANAAQQSNGLWFDVGPGTDGTDGAGDKGTISSEKFLQDWVTMAKRWVGNSTVIGYDLRNEPCAHTSTPALWGGRGPTDIHQMYQSVGNAILDVDPNKLIICESIINYKIDAYEGDLSPVRTLPIKIKNLGKLVYSVHEYPKEVGGYRGAESGPDYVARMEKTWGWIVRENIAPVWIGEMGSSMNTPQDLAWGDTLLGYMGGTIPNGLPVGRHKQPVSGDWWAWGYQPGNIPDGCLGADGNLRPEQAPSIDKLLFTEANATPAKTSDAITPGTWEPMSVNGMNMHQLDMGDWPVGLLQEIDPWFRSVAWRTAYPAIVLCPFLDQTADKSGKTVNFGGVSDADQAGQDNAIIAVREIMDRYSVDPRRIYVTGNSMGGIGTWDVLIKYNIYTGTSGRIFAAGMPLAGATYDHGYPNPDPAVLTALKNVPIWAIHGANDTQVPLVWDRVIAAAYIGSPTFHETIDPNLGHDVWDTYYALPAGKANWDWLFAQKAPAGSKLNFGAIK
jgi:endoglucanase